MSMRQIDQMISSSLHLLLIYKIFAVAEFIWYGMAMYGWLVGWLV